MENVSQWEKGKIRLEQDVSLKNKILICMDFTFITYLYGLAFSKHLLEYFLTCLYCAILFLSCILMSKQEISSYIYPLNILINISLHHILVFKHA